MAMDVPVNLRVNFRGRVESFLVSDWKRSSWESMEAMMKTSFGLTSLQVKYLDEDKEEVFINSQEEYQEALKSAVKQGYQLNMNVYKTKAPADRVVKAKGKEVKTRARPAPPYPSMIKTVDRETQVPVLEQDGVLSEVRESREDNEAPPQWFTSYMEKFKDQVVKEAVDRICHEFSGQCCIHKLPHLASTDPAGPSVQVPEVSSTVQGAAGSTTSCSSCQGQMSGGGYQCSVCPAYTLCEQCSYAHDPSHHLLRAGTPLSIPEYGVPGEHYRLQRQGERSFRKAEKQRLKAEKRQLKAEVKEIRKQLRMEKRGLQLSSACDRSPQPVLLVPRGTQIASPERPKIACPTVVPAMTALFLDENLPDGTRMQPGTKFIKYWKMRNTGSVSWTTETKLKFMWGNLSLASREKGKEVAVPFLQPGQVGVVNVAFVAPVMEGTYTSHWRLAHRGEQFGPRVWCSIVVDADARPENASPYCTAQEKEHSTADKDGACCAAARDRTPVSTGSDREYYIPSVDLLTAQDLLSFELLDINIVQELERVPHNTPADMTPCMSPVPNDGALSEKRNLSLIKVEAEAEGVKSLLGVAKGAPKQLMAVPAQEEGEEDISGTQFVCETVIRSLTLEEAPDRRPLRRVQADCSRAQEPLRCERAGQEQAEGRGTPSVAPAVGKSEEPVHGPPEAMQDEQAEPETCADGEVSKMGMEPGSQSEAEEDGDRDEVRSQASSVSSEDYIVILPDCFDTSRPLAESMYSSALSQAGSTEGGPGPLDRATPEGERKEEALCASGGDGGVNDMLCTSQTLDAVPLTPVVVTTPGPATPLSPTRSQLSCMVESGAIVNDKLYQSDDPMDGSSRESSPVTVTPPDSADSSQQDSQDPRAHGGIAGGLVKGALSVAASAYKALFTGQPGPPLPPGDAASQDTTMMAVLLEMGFGDRQLNRRLLRKHNHNLLDVVNELVQMADNEWYATRY
uniref:NBR1 autophagy cargo receptor a n=1 Tax=Paramormyrops kingsleyae TaxID=1676925 RepID=A0A3B3RAQ2_9TELE|nr:next to BRCA1 gene 1 protein [Paramormyrops kingsleyae]